LVANPISRDRGKVPENTGYLHRGTML